MYGGLKFTFLGGVGPAPLSSPASPRGVIWAWAGGASVGWVG